MNDQRNVKISKRLSYVLRHRPDSIGIELDPQGWIPVDGLLASLAADGFDVTPGELAYVVETNDKQRFQVDDGGRIRAAQGHSVDVELGLDPVTPPPLLFHGTARHRLESIHAEGLRSMNRTHVHLSAQRSTAIAVGTRHGEVVVLDVDAAAMVEAGHRFFQAANGVWLTDTVPPAFLSEG